MKIFAKESMKGRQHKIPGLSYLADLCFMLLYVAFYVAHKLIMQIDEDGHLHYKNDQIRKEFIENPDPDPDAGFDLDAEIAKIYNYINKSSVKLAVNSAEKSLKERFAKELLSTCQAFLNH